VNAKNLNKKIRRLVERIEKDTRKLAKLRLKLTNAETRKKESGATKKVAAGKKSTKAKAKKRAKPNISPERRAELSAAMKARWAAKRAAASGASNSSPA
jgi:hypothetical protein